MKRNSIGMWTIGGVACGLLFSAALAGDGGFSIEGSTIGAGGHRAVGGDYELSNTIGQVGGTNQVGGDYDMTSGSQSPFAATDCNGDRRVNLLDHVDAAVCWDGPGGETPIAACRCFDVNANGTVDLADYAQLQNDFDGLP